MKHDKEPTQRLAGSNQDDPWAPFRASPAKRAAFLAEARPFDVDDWLRGSVPPSPEELVDLEDFLRQREAERQTDLPE